MMSALTLVCDYVVMALDYQTATFGIIPSLSGDLMNKSSQRLMRVDVSLCCCSFSSVK